MKKSLVFLASLILSSVSHASSMRDLTSAEVDTLNWLLQCPAEIAQVTAQHGQWIGSGRFVSDRTGSKFSYRFFRQSGFTTSEYVTTLNVSRIRIQNPPADSPGFRVECEIQKETQL